MGEGKEHSSSETPDVSHIHTPGVAHEESDVKVSSVAWFTVGLAALVLLTGLLMWGMFRLFARTEERKEPPPSSLTQEKKPESANPEEMFPEPRLQRTPLQDLQRYRDEEKGKLKEYGWVDQNAGIVRIPIEEAKKKLVKQGLPYRQPSEPGVVILDPSSAIKAALRVTTTEGTDGPRQGSKSNTGSKGAKSGNPPREKR
jgi:cytoskeletal protein RodZ